MFGSRMMTKGAARRGGMPLYKYVGNRILSTVPEPAAADAASPSSTPATASTRVAALARDPVRATTPTIFHFDTEIIIQLMLGGFRIDEVPIPTYYGDEICRVNGHEVTRRT